MITTTIWFYLVWCVDHDSERANRRLAIVLSTLLALWILCAPKIHYEHNVVFENVFGLMIIVNMARLGQLVYRSSDKNAKFTYIYYVSTVAVGFVAWLIDLHACDWLHSTGLYWLKLGSLHGWWHVIIGMSCYVGPLLCKRLRAEHLRQPIELAHAPPSLLGIPHLIASRAFDSKRRRSRRMQNKQRID